MGDAKKERRKKNHFFFFFTECTAKLENAPFRMGDAPTEEVLIFLSLAFDVMKTNARRTWHIALGLTDIPHTRAHPPPPRAPHLGREKGE